MVDNDPPKKDAPKNDPPNNDKPNESGGKEGHPTRPPVPTPTSEDFPALPPALPLVLPGAAAPYPPAVSLPASTKKAIDASEPLGASRSVST